LFAAAFFPQNPGKLVFYIYITGIVLGIVTGLILKHTLFQGEPTHFIMELPPYHLPRARHIFLHTWERLKIFIWRAGKFIVPMVLVLGILNTVGTDGSIGNEDKKESILSVVGKTITPVFEPIGVESDNWPASVSIFTGLFAKESVIGTMKGLYGQDDAKVNETEAEKEYSLVGGLKKAFASIPEGLSGVWSGLIDPLGFAGAEEEAHDGTEDEKKSTIDSLKRHFPKGVHQMYSFLLFILLYVPCIAATGVVFREIGKLYGTIFVGYLTLLGWSVATIYHAVMVSQSGMWLIVGTGILALMFGSFWLYGKKHRVDMI
jgi:ferrous iron transport protein B